MEWVDVRKRIETGDNYHTGFKRAATNLNAVGKAVCAFANTEEQAITAAEVGDIDLDSFRKYLQRLGLETDEEPQPGATDDLFNRGVLTEHDGKRCPTLYGLMAFGKDPQRFPPTDNLRIECVAYAGADRTDTPLVPLKALREVIVNAVAHRDYAIIGSKILLEVFEDRVVVTNPGTLPNHMTVESVRSGRLCK